MEKMIIDARVIMAESIREVMPDKAVQKALENITFEGNLTVIAVGKAAWTMAKTADEILGDRIQSGLVITKYGHSKGKIGRFHIVEAGHPIVDENSISGAELALELVRGLSEKDTVILLLSGGGSALFEKPLEGLRLEDLADVSAEMLKCGADITEFNTIRKHLSAVKGGRFAEACLPAKVYTIVLSDVLGDRLDTIASGPACSDSSTAEDAIAIVRKYGFSFSNQIMNCLNVETPKEISNCETVITGNVQELCKAAEKTARNLGYETLILTTNLEGEALNAGQMFATLAASVVNEGKPLKPPCCIIAGGETVVKIKGNGKGGRNQEMALAAAEGISGMDQVLFFSLGSDGTDGPTDAAGGMVNGFTKEKLAGKNIVIKDFLDTNNSYEALKECDGLIITGPTGTNVNDLQVLLVGRPKEDER